MLLHLGKDSVIPLKDIIAIIDKESAFKSEDTKKFFELVQKQGDIKNTTDKVKTYILTQKTEIEKKSRRKIKKTIIYTSNISSMTLKQRAGFMEDMTNI